MINSLLAFRLRLSAFIFLLFAFNSPKAQNITSFSDYMNKFYVFDNGALTKLEHLPIQSQKAADDLLAYIDNVNNFKIYQYGKKEMLEGLVDNYQVYKGLVVYETAGIIKAYANGKRLVLSPRTHSYKAADGIVAYIDLFDRAFKVHTDTIKVLEMHSSDLIINSFRVGNNTMAYVDAMDNFYLYHEGERELIFENFRGSYEVGRGIVAFQDNYDYSFKAFYKGEIIDLDMQYPKSYKMANEIVAWVSANDAFSIFYDGEITELASYAPSSYQLKDDIMTYFQNGYFYMFYNGEKIEVSQYMPSEYFVDNQTLVYRDQQGYVHAYIKGEHVEITRQPCKDLKLNGDVIYYTVNGNEPRVYYKGQELEY